MHRPVREKVVATSIFRIHRLQNINKKVGGGQLTNSDGSANFSPFIPERLHDCSIPVVLLLG